MWCVVELLLLITVTINLKDLIMKRTKEIGEKILKYAEEKIQERSEKTSQRIKKYARSLNDVSSELSYASKIMAGHKKIVID